MVNDYVDFEASRNFINKRMEHIFLKNKEGRVSHQYHISDLESVLWDITRLRDLARTDDECWVADFLYTDCLNAITDAKIGHACSVIDKLEGYELINVLKYINKAIKADSILQA